MLDTLVANDLKHVWHPCSQMKDYEAFPPLAIQRAQGCFLQLKGGKRLIDAFSSWWCKSLGHNEPRIKQAIEKQYQRFEHVITANTTFDALVDLSSKLATLKPPLGKVMYACDGSSAMEIAAKMAVHAQQLRGQPQRQQFMALGNGYHGETCLTLSLSDLGLYNQPYQALMHPVPKIHDVPYVTGRADPLWHDAAKPWQQTEAQLQLHQDTLAALVVEPLLQGAGGMKVYSADWLHRLATWCKQHDIYLITDEILTGFGRTGLPLATDHNGITPDFIALGKGLTAGTLPLSAVLTHDDVYDLFYDDYETGKAFMHSHTHTGNALAIAAANATWDCMQQDQIYSKLPSFCDKLHHHFEEVVHTTGKLTNVRMLGAVCAADLITSNHSPKRLGYQVYQEAIQRGALLRPLGNTLYWLPPLNTPDDVLAELTHITIEAIEAAY